MNKITSKKRILLIDDDPLFVRMYERMLLQNGYEVRTARNGKEGMEAMRVYPPSLVIVDLLMPEMNGLEVLREAKQDPELKGIPIVVLTSLSDGQRQATCLKAGAAGYYTKDIKTAKMFLEGIKAVIG